MKKIAITQSNYVPWRGYFDLINYVDEFIFFDEVQYTRRDWRNRNLIRNVEKKIWITIPVNSKGKYFSNILDMKIADQKWFKKHLDLISHNYKKSKYFNETYPFFEQIFKMNRQDKLYLINRNIIVEICKYLKINTKFNYSEDIAISFKEKDPSLRLIEICKKQNATTYVTGPAAKSYLDENLFTRENIKIKFFDYKECKKYQQSGENFIPKLSIIDCIFNCGVNKKDYFNYI
jgi:hypothetical protein